MIPIAGDTPNERPPLGRLSKLGYPVPKDDPHTKRHVFGKLRRDLSNDHSMWSGGDVKLGPAGGGDILFHVCHRRWYRGTTDYCIAQVT